MVIPLHHRILLLLILLLILGTAGCTAPNSVPSPAGMEAKPLVPQADDRWWSLYERGLALAEAERFKEAMAEFEKAAELRSEDKWRAETGTGLQVDYFPLREMGIIAFRTREYDRAVELLESSLLAESSARAAYFLDQARSGRESRSRSDRKKPELYLEASTATEITNRLVKRVKGVARDDTFITAIRVNGTPIFIEPAARQKIFTTVVPLQEGMNTIRVTATDLAGKEQEQRLEVFCDLAGPLIELESFEVIDGRVHFKGKVSDNKGLASLYVNDQSWPISGNQPVYRFTFNLPDGPITIRAQDLAGNTTTATVRRDETLRLPSSSDDGISSATGEERDDRIFSVTAEETVEERQPPFIHVNGGAVDRETVEDHFLLEGMVSDSSLLIYVSVQGRQILQRQGKKIYFSLTQPLAAGNNEVVIAAADENGNKNVRHLNIFRKIPRLFRNESRMKLAVLPFAGSIGKTDSPEVSFGKTGRFSVIDTDTTEKALAALFGIGAPLDEKQAAQVGRALGADCVLTGTIRNFSGSREISARIIDSDSARVLIARDVFIADYNPDGPDGVLDQLAGKFVRDLPLAEGTVIGIEEGEIILDIGKDHKIGPGMRMLCYRTGPPVFHPVTGKLRQADPSVISVLKVIDAQDQTSRAVPLEPEAEIIISDQVIAL